MRSQEIRNRFLDHFTARGHVRLPSGSLVPPDWDTSVLITTAGMQPLKRYFLGADAPPAPRATTVQKCFRTVDIDEVGRTARHLTFFEMMGNFSFGDYFKDYAVDDRLGPGHVAGRVRAATPTGSGRPCTRATRSCPPTRRPWPSGGPSASPPTASSGWATTTSGRQVPTGPCGPCSELYLDRGAAHGCGRPECAPGCECDRFLEFWNLVFMQYNMLEGGSLEPLPAPSVDTGCGVERVAAACRTGVHSVFETDVFSHTLAEIERWSGARLGVDPQQTRAMCVLADHARAMTFLATDGVVPGNEGRGYVLRRVIRRAIVHGRRIGLEAASPAAARRRRRGAGRRSTPS